MNLKENGNLYFPFIKYSWVHSGCRAIVLIEYGNALHF